MGDVIVVDQKILAARRCRYCNVKIYPESAHKAHEARHEARRSTDIRICKQGHEYYYNEQHVFYACPICRGEKIKRGHRRTGNRGGRPESGGWRARKKAQKGQ